MPKELIRAVNERATASARASIDHFKPEDRHAIVGDIDKVPRKFEFMELEKAYPNACAFVTLWLPGYNDGGERAVLRMFFGPTAHGAAATFLLRKDRDGRWVVYAMQLSYYA